VAKQYQANLSKGNVRILVGGNDVTPDVNFGLTGDKLVQRGEDMALAWVETNASAKDPIGNARRAVQKILDDPMASDFYRSMANDAAKTLDGWKAQGATIKPGGALYTAELPHANPEDFLDWDKPLSQQSEKVRKALEGLAGPESPLGPTMAEQIRARLQGADQGYTFNNGEGLLRAWHDKRAATDALRAAGIKGIRYLDGGSRGNGAAAAHWERVLAEGNATGEYGGLTRQQVLDKLDEAKNALSSNYVVFDDADINILHREGNTGLKMLLGMTGAGAAAAAAPKLIPKRH
jgi:hypothetical protein